MAVELDGVELLAAYHRDGNESAFAELVERHSTWIFAAARRRLRDDHLADDATQAAFVVLAGKAEQLIASRRGSLSAWLFHVVHFTCARLRRSQIRQMELEHLADRDLVPEERKAVAGNEPLLLLLEDCIAQLPADLREMIVRRFYRRQRFAEIGKAMRLSSEAVRKRVSRTLEEIRY